MARKFYNNKTFKINDDISIKCSTQDTSYGFRHVADALVNGRYVAYAKCCYHNRTWESYEYQSVIKKIAESKDLAPEDRSAIAAYAAADHTDNSDLNTIAGIMALGDILADGQKEANDWKTRMLRAGLEGRGLDMPEDWDNLTEDEKTRRLDGVIATLSNEREEVRQGRVDPADWS